MKILVKKDWNSITRAYGVEYCCDGADDIASLPTVEISAGSSAISIEEGKIYIFNGTEWKKFGE